MRPQERPDSRASSDATGGALDVLSPEAAFKTVGNETRLAILDVLWGPGPAEPMPFGELRKAVGMRDGSQFNYHLRKLVDGGFIGKDDDGRYYIHQAGARVICTITTGYLTTHPELDPFETDGRCYACDGALAANYTGEMFFVRCVDCETLHTFGPFPPNAVLDRTPADALMAFEHVRRTVKSLADAGICSICNGSMDRTVARTWAEVPIWSPVLDETAGGAVRAWSVCSHCGVWVFVTPGESVLEHPAVVDLYRAHGVDLRSVPRWALPWTIDESCLDVVSDDPFEVRVTIDLDGDVRVLTLDEAFDVVGVESTAPSC
ncbi:helix-turn-helix domain-containing protein [Halorubellus litoreus]|uniref:Winged helix-turn-helix domain-containing protein n=1 Tax=Halorubellus litoreus TaxID=755308 RepID=A0ABD5VIV3_9EURY